MYLHSQARMLCVFSFYTAYALTGDRPSRKNEKARLLAHLAFASSPLFTAIGVLCFLFHTPHTDYAVWALLWIALGIFALRNEQRSIIPTRSRLESARLRMAHGISAHIILLRQLNEQHGL